MSEEYISGACFADGEAITLRYDKASWWHPGSISGQVHATETAVPAVVIWRRRCVGRYRKSRQS